jgi:hypothetical protein
VYSCARAHHDAVFKAASLRMGTLKMFEPATRLAAPALARGGNAEHVRRECGMKPPLNLPYCSEPHGPLSISSSVSL